MEKEKTDKMKAPDKIYVPCSKDCSDCVDIKLWTRDPLRGGHEYIRKDFLIDKLARAKALREKSGSRDTEIFDALINLIKET